MKTCDGRNMQKTLSEEVIPGMRTQPICPHRVWDMRLKSLKQYSQCTNCICLYPDTISLSQLYASIKWDYEIEIRMDLGTCRKISLATGNSKHDSQP